MRVQAFHRLCRITITAIFVATVANPALGQERQATNIRESMADHAARAAEQPPTVRQSDSLLNGALIGAGAAIATGLFWCTRMEPWENCRDDVGPMLTFGAIGAGIGIAVDALIRERRVSGAAAPPSAVLHATPIVAPAAKGLRVSLKF
jgi:hypothetical protein